MKALSVANIALGLAIIATLVGCSYVPKTQLTSAESHARALAEQNKALLAEIENRNAHGKQMEDRVRRAEEDLALLEEDAGIDHRQLAMRDHTQDDLKRRISRLAGGNRIPSDVGLRLDELARKYPSLLYDPETGAAKLDVDVLFETADDQLRPEAQKVLTEFAEIFQENTARDLKIMVVGHTDDRGLKRSARDRYRNNWQLSTARALAVADFLRNNGVPEDRMGVTGFAQYQPVGHSKSGEDRNRNRRVEIFVLGPETPIVGWTEPAGRRLR